MKQPKSIPISKEMVWEAWKKVRSNRGAAGIDGESVSKFEENLGNNLYVLWNRMSSGSYFPPAVREVAIPKGKGRKRLLGIPTVRDRTAQQVIKNYLEPRLEPEFHDSSFGYRPGRSQRDALEQCRRHCWEYAWVIDMDISNFFGELKHDLLWLGLDRHVSENWVKMYLDRWLTAPIAKADGDVEARDRGVPQGSVIGPLLANLYLHYGFDKWMSIYHGATPFERYADDIIVHCRSLAEAESLLMQIEERLNECGLCLNQEKTRIVYCKQSNRDGDYPNVSFDFLGYTFKPRKVRTKDGRLKLGFSPSVSNKAVKKFNHRLRLLGIHRWVHLELGEIAEVLNPIVRGWINYYSWYHKIGKRYAMFLLNARLANWVQQKYRRYRTNRSGAFKWLEGQSRKHPDLFAHWAIGYRPKLRR